MGHLLREIRHNPLLWLLAFVPAVFARQKLGPGQHVLLFILSELAIVPLAAPGSPSCSCSSASTPSSRRSNDRQVTRTLVDS
jgi:Ca2+:H+ antiporter